MDDLGRVKGPGGRPEIDITSEEMSGPFLQYLREGMSFREACALIGISRTTARKWINAGKHDLAGGRDSKLAEFAVEVEKALTEAKHLRIQALNNAAAIPAFWAAAAWWLERRYPQEFGRQDRVNMNMSGTLGLNQAANIEVTEVEKDAIRSILGKLGTNQADDSEGEPIGFGSSDSAEFLPLP